MIQASSERAPAARRRIAPYLWVVVLVFLGVTLLTTYLFVLYREQILIRAERDSMNLARVLDENLSSIFKRLDADLYRSARQIDPDSLAARDVERFRRQWEAALSDIKIGFPEVSGSYLFAANGDLLASSEAMLKPFNASNREHFVQLRDNPRLELAISDVVTARTTGVSTIIAARAIRGGDGRFLGMISVALDLQQFKRLFETIDIGQQGIVAIRKTDGARLVLRHPERWGEINKGISSPITRRIAAGEPLGSERFVSPVDGIARIWSFRVLPDYPFNINVGLSEDEVLAIWQQRAYVSASVLAVLLLIFAYAVYRVWVSEKQKDGLLLRLQESQDELLQQQAKLLQANRRHRAIEESIEESMWLLSADGTVIEVSPTAVERIGRSKEELVGKDVFAFLEPELAAARRAHFREAVRSRSKVSLEDRRDGRDYLNTYYPVIDAAGECHQVVIVATDISARKAYEAQILDQQRHLSAVLDGTRAGTWEWNIQTGRMLCNERWAEIVGYTLAELEPITLDTWARLAHPDDRKRSREVLEKHLRGEISHYDFEIRVQHKDGQWIWVVDRGKVTAWTADGQPLLMSGTQQDITARKRMEAELEDYRQHLEKLVEIRTADLEVAKEAAEEASRAKTTFLTMASHELRTPMNGVLGTITLAMKKATDPKLLDYLTKASQASRQLMAVINDVLDISLIESGRLTLAATPFSLGEMRDSLLNTLGAIAKTKGLQLDWRMQGLDVGMRFVGDPTRLNQILINLAGNALKFTFAGTVVITARSVPSPSAGKTRLRFEVQDTGMGIAPEDQSRIFEPFEQVDSSETRKFAGTGLGLALCKKLTAAMGGSIGVSSQPGHGSLFWFEVELAALPPEDALPTEESTAGEALLARHRGAQILLVEDEPLNQEIARAMLEEVGLAVTVASDGLEAIACCRASGFDLILMDMNMPNMGGVDAAGEIRRLASHAGTPIVAMTANAFTSDRDACVQAGMNDHVAKPVMPEVLYAAVLRWLDTDHRIAGSR